MSDELKDLTSSREVVEAQHSGAYWVEKTHGLTIGTDAGVEYAADLARELKAAGSRLEELRKFFVKPLNDQVKRINDLFRGYAEPITKADAVVRDAVLDYRRRQYKIAQAEQARLDATAAKAQARIDKKAEKIGITAPQIVVPVVPEPAKTVAGVTARTVWKWRVVDPPLVPREYLVVDGPKLTAAVAKGLRELPGVTIYSEEILAVRG